MSEQDIDLFAGAGGWDWAARELGLDPLGIEWDADACATREAAGLRTLKADVAALNPEHFRPCRMLIGSPPCPTFSAAGNVQPLYPGGLPVAVRGTCRYCGKDLALTKPRSRKWGPDSSARRWHGAEASAGLSLRFCEGDLSDPRPRQPHCLGNLGVGPSILDRLAYRRIPFGSRRLIDPKGSLVALLQRAKFVSAGAHASTLRAGRATKSLWVATSPRSARRARTLASRMAPPWVEQVEKVVTVEVTPLMVRLKVMVKVGAIWVSLVVVLLIGLLCQGVLAVSRGLGRKFLRRCDDAG